MRMEQDRNEQKEQAPAREPYVQTGNASNPSPSNPIEEMPENQVLGKQAEKYLREVANIEDEPDAEEEEEAEEIEKEDQ
jgi:hypothetical protein